MERNCVRLKQQEIAILRASIANLNALKDSASLLDGLSITDGQQNLASVSASP